MQHDRIINPQIISKAAGINIISRYVSAGVRSGAFLLTKVMNCHSKVQAAFHEAEISELCPKHTQQLSKTLFARLRIIRVLVVTFKCHILQTGIMEEC